MKPIFTSITPNAQAEDILLNLVMLTAPGQWQKGRAIGELEDTFAKFLGVESVISFDSGRTALFAILQALKLEPASEVLMQAYTCVAVPDPVLWAGLTPVYVDIDKETLNMSAAELEKKITPKSKALIIQHTFGFPADIDKLMAIAKAHNLFVIEDCAHALGATYKGKLVGTFGDTAFFSFGRDKVISSTFGGMVTVRDKKLAEQVSRIQNAFPFPRRGWIAKQLLHPLIMGKGKLLYNVLGIGKLTIYLAKKLGLTSPAVYPVERLGGRPPFVFHRLANALAAAAHKQLSKIGEFNEHRKLIARLYREGLPQFASGMQKPLADTAPICLRVVLRHEKRAEITAAAKKQNILLGDWYTNAIAPDFVDYDAIKYNRADYPNAEAAARDTLNLPTDIHISEADAQRIIKFLSQWK
jgi:perosamine synthetase